MEPASEHPDDAREPTPERPGGGGDGEVADRDAADAAPPLDADVVDPGGGDGEGATIRVASIAKRAAARVIDTIIVFGLREVVAIALVGEVEEGEEIAAGLVALVLVLYTVIVFAYEAGIVAWQGRTPGKLAMQIRIVDAEDGGRVTGRQAVLRAALPTLVLSLLFPLLGLYGLVAYAVVYLSAAWDGSQRGWPDRLAGTRVVPEGSQGPSGAKED